MEALVAIFGSLPKVKILRLFLFNPEASFSLEDISRRTQTRTVLARRELLALLKADILKKRQAGGVQSYSLNGKFAYLEPLKNLLTVSSIAADETLARRFSSVGKLKLFVTAGVFIQDWDSRVDLLLVGDSLNLHKIETVIKGLEAEIGKEISYSAFETADFEYRFGIHDRLIRDILDYPHVTLLDRLGVEPR
jgi:hypothetical protein